jgi:alginate O-acetyltransferase complex protein AlgJ
MSRLLDWLYTLTFCAAIAAVPVGSALGFRVTPAERLAAEEQRSPSELAPMGTGRRALKAMFESIEGYCSDRMACRAEWIALAASLRRSLGVPQRPDRVVVGSDGWWFLGNSSERGIDQHRGLRQLSDDELSAIIGYWMSIHELLASRGIPFVAVIVPEKPSVYGEHLPIYLRGGGLTPTDQVMRAGRGGLRVIDLRPAMLAAKRSSDLLLYHKNDSHWNDWGSYVGFQEIADALGVRGAFEAELGDFVPTMSKNGDLSRLVGPDASAPSETAGIRDSVFRGTVDLRLIGDSTVQRLPVARPIRLTDMRSAVVTNPERTGTVLVLGDSFTDWLTRYFNSSFGTVVYQHYFHFGADGGQAVEGLVDTYRPDAVVFEIAGRLLVAPVGAMIPPARKEQLVLLPEQLVDACRAGRGIEAVSLGTDGVRLSVIGSDPYFQLPRLPPMPDGATMTLDMTLPGQRMVQVYYQTAKRPEMCEEQSVRAPGTSGRSSVTVRIADALDGTIRIDPGNGPGEYVIHRIAISP